MDCGGSRCGGLVIVPISSRLWFVGVEYEEAWTIFCKGKKDNKTILATSSHQSMLNYVIC